MLVLESFSGRERIGRWCTSNAARRREAPTYDPPFGEVFTFVSRQRIRSLTLACALDSLVRVTRRVELDRPNDVWVGVRSGASELVGG